ncbi:MAG: arylesterase [Alphaproteobacteria bacterium]|nr:arylesterase [Alphaproteobacteria bacterium]
MRRGGHVSSHRVSALKLRRYGAALALFNAMAFAMAMPASAKTPHILALGDSLTSGYGLPASEAFPARLQAKLQQDGINVAVANAGVAGDTTTDGLARLDWALADKPDLVILALGANDMLRGIDPDTVRANLDRMIGKIEAAGAKVLLLGMQAAPNWGADYQHAFDAIYPELAKAHNVPLYPFFLDGVAMNPALNQPDGMHPNERGVAVMVDHIAPLVAKMVGGAPGDKS